MRVRVHPLALGMMALAVLLGEALPMSMLLASVTLHELGHIGAARASGMPVRELELMPCGGAARFDNVWQLHPVRLCLTAAAGPAVNLVLALLCAAAAWSGWLEKSLWAEAAGINVLLMTFNLLPALPLDGGRILAALLMRKLPPQKAVTAAIRCGQGLGGLLIALGCVQAVRGSVNLTWMMTGLYLLLSAPQEKRSLTGAVLQGLMSRGTQLLALRVMPVRTLAVSEKTRLSEAASRLTPGCVHRFLVLDGAQCEQRLLSEREFMRALMKDPGAEFGALSRP